MLETLSCLLHPNVSVLTQKFKNNGLLAHENEVDQLQEEGDRLVEKKHPGSPAIQVSSLSDTVSRLEITHTSQIIIKLNCICQTHRDAVQTRWQAFLNLCLAQEIHLDNIENYRKVKSL